MSAPSAVADYWTDKSSAYIGFMLALGERPEVIAGNLGLTVDQAMRRLRGEGLDDLAGELRKACAAARDRAARNGSG